MPGEIVIKTTRLEIRTYQRSDVDELFTILGDRNTMHFWPAPFTRKKCESWIMENLQRYRNFGFGRWGIYLKESGVLIGDIGISPAHINDQYCFDLGCVLEQKYWKKGYALEACLAVRDFAFELLGLDHLVATMPTDHDDARALAEKLNMKQQYTFLNPKNRELPTYLYRIDLET